MPTRERLWFLLLVAAAFICVSLPGCWRGTVQQRNSVSLSDEEMLVVTSEDGIAFVDFLSFAPTGEEESKYRWRYLDTRTGEEQSGEGVVFEKYDKVRTGPNTYRVKDAGGQLLVKAGPFEIEWSFGFSGGLGMRPSGWLYPDEAEFYVVSDKDYLTFDMEGFVETLR